MKRMMKRLLPVLMAIAPLTICAQKVYELKDISGKVQVNVIVNDKNVEYSVLHDNDVMVAPFRSTQHIDAGISDLLCNHYSDGRHRTGMVSRSRLPCHKRRLV